MLPADPDDKDPEARIRYIEHCASGHKVTPLPIEVKSAQTFLCKLRKFSNAQADIAEQIPDTTVTRNWKIFDQLDFAGFAARGPNAAAKLFFSSLSYGAGDKTAHMNKKLRQSGLFQLYEEVVSAIEHDGGQGQD